MRFFKLFLAAVAAVGITLEAFEQDTRIKTIAFLTSSMFSKMHYVKRGQDAETSKMLFDEYLKSLDPMHLFFTAKQVESWKRHRSGLIAKLSTTGDVSFAFNVYNEYLKRLDEYEKFVEGLQFSDQDFKGNETFAFDRSKSDWPASEAELKQLWTAKIKNDVITFMLLERVEKEEKKDGKKLWKKRTPLERVKKRIASFVELNKKIEPLEALETYLNSLAHLYDPHTSYMAPKTVENFNIGMKLSLVGIGALLSSEDGYTKIVQIIPGGPAERDGRLKADDRIISVAQDKAEPVDVIDMPLNKVVDMIRGEENTKVTLTVLRGAKGAKSAPENIALVRKKVELKESEAKGAIRKVKAPDGRELKLGVITLPSFYVDFAAASRGDTDFKSSTRDVSKILEDFRKQGPVDGLIVDLRSNGGGSLYEAVTLTGLFIKSGPVVQIRDAKDQIEVKNDNDGGQIQYDGPMCVLTNRFSASASEIFAGALKDYQRAVIIGDSKTHGKGSVQTIADLDTYLPYLGFHFKGGSIKLTNAKFYRVNGASTQLKGVVPDIVFPSFTDSMDAGEEQLDHAMKWDNIPEAAYTIFNPLLPEQIRKLRALSEKRIRSSRDFTMLRKDIQRYKENKNRKYVSLNLEKRWKEYLEEKKLADEQVKLLRLTDNLSKEELGKNKHKDIYLDETLAILSDLVDCSKKTQR